MSKKKEFKKIIRETTVGGKHGTLINNGHCLKW
jgi:hypothetical protein